MWALGSRVLLRHFVASVAHNRLVTSLSKSQQPWDPLLRAGLLKQASLQPPAQLDTGTACTNVSMSFPDALPPSQPVVVVQIQRSYLTRDCSGAAVSLLDTYLQYSCQVRGFKPTSLVGATNKVQHTGNKKTCQLVLTTLRRRCPQAHSLSV